MRLLWAGVSKPGRTPFAHFFAHNQFQEKTFQPYQLIQPPLLSEPDIFITRTDQGGANPSHTYTIGGMFGPMRSILLFWNKTRRYGGWFLNASPLNKTKVIKVTSLSDLCWAFAIETNSAFNQAFSLDTFNSNELPT